MIRINILYTDMDGRLLIKLESERWYASISNFSSVKEAKKWVQDIFPEYEMYNFWGNSV